MIMPAAKLDLTIEQGATFKKRLTWKDNSETPIDLTGYTARMQVRAAKEDDNVLLDLNTINGRIILGDVNGTIDLLIDEMTTTNIIWSKGVYDLEMIEAGGEVIRLVEGGVTVSFEVTR